LESKEVVLQQAAIAALGEIKDIESIDHILRFAQSDDWLVRQRLAESLGCLPSPKSISALKWKVAIVTLLKLPGFRSSGWLKHPVNEEAGRGGEGGEFPYLKAGASNNDVLYPALASLGTTFPCSPLPGSFKLTGRNTFSLRPCSFPRL